MQDHITAQQYWEMITDPKPSKMRNIKTEVDGMLFDSQKEANYYCELKLRKKAGEIVDFFWQVPFLLHEGYYKNKRWVKPIYYKADFVVIPSDLGFEMQIEVHEVKGRWTRTAIDKRKMFERRYTEYKMVII